MQPLTRRLRVNLKSSFQRIVAVHQGEVRVPAFEQLGEQALEVGVDRFECGAEPFAAFAIEIADRAAQAVDGFDQFGLFGHARAVPRFDFGQFVRCDQVHRTDPFAFGNQLVMLRTFLRGGADFGGLEFKPFGQERRRALEALARDSCHFGAAALFVLRASHSAGTGFAGRGQGFVGTVELGVDPPRGIAQFVDLGFSGGQLGGKPGADFVPGLDLAHQAGRLGRDDCALFGDFLEPPGHRGEAAGSIAGAGLPRLDVRALGVAAFPRDGQGLIVRGQRGSGRLQALPCRIVAGLRRCQLRAAGFGIGQLPAPVLCRLAFGFGQGALLGQIGCAGGKFGAARLDPCLGRFGLVHGAQGGALRIGSGGNGAFGGDQGQLQFGQFGADRLGLRLGRFHRAAQRGQFAFQSGQAVFRFQPRRFRRAFALRDKAIPAANAATTRHQPFAWTQRAAIVGIADMDQRQPRLQFVRALGDMGQQTVRHRAGRVGSGPEPAVGIGRSRAQRSLGIPAQHGGEGALVTRRGADRIKRGAAMLALRLPGACIAVAHQRLPFALHPRQLRLGRGQCR